MLSVHAGGAGIPPAVKAGHWSTSQQKTFTTSEIRESATSFMLRRLFRSSTVTIKELYTFLPSPQPHSNEPGIPLSSLINIHAQP